MHEHHIAPGVRGWLESPASDVIASDCLVVCGWAYATDAQIIDVWSTGFGVQRPLHSGIERADVARRYPDETNARVSGFTGYLELEGTPGERVNFDVWARLSDGRTVRLFQRALVMQARGHETSRIRAAARQALRRPQILLSPRAWLDAFKLLTRVMAGPAQPQSPSLTGRASLRRQTRASLANFLKSHSEPSFMSTAIPDVSIVVVAWNHADLTLGCLQALEREEEASGVSTEVVIVDNASTDETSQLLSRVRGATVVRNSTNLGFTMALNIGARAARGEFLLFVNNDAAVIAGTLRRLLETARRSSAIGAVGGKLIYPDGRLQEAGSIIWADGSCESYGRGQDPDAPEYNFERPVDFCSAALLLTRRSLFNQLHGFDERYRPAYYDDVDYCVRVWESGHSVVYQPRAAATHCEFGSTSPEASAELQRSRRPIFVSTHRRWLTSQMTAGVRQVQRARVHPHGRASVIVIDDTLPDPRAGSGFPRAARLIETLIDLGYLVTLYATNPASGATAGEGIEVVAGGPDGLRAFLTSRNHQDVVIISRPHNMQYVKAAVGSDLSALGAPCIYDAEAIYALRERERRRVLGMPMSEDTAQAMFDAELGLARGCAAVLAVNDIERERFERFGTANVYVVGHAVEGLPTPRPFEQRGSLLFVGAFDAQSPNEDAVSFFCLEVMPILRSSGCRAPLVVAGAHLPDRLRSLTDSSVSWHSDVDDLTPFYDDARVFVAPTRYSAGISLKVIEAAARGVPVVSTSTVARQLGWTPGKELLAADSAVEFARAVASLVSDAELWRRLRESALARVTSDCAPGVFRAVVETALHHAVRSSAHDVRTAPALLAASIGSSVHGER
ncbi:MAG TPA: glycosyltransferase [Vicinamibacterales bacterium]|jgi:GT2 family glycosyltransferase|nr:glycosyltransferase [Vicinamibacterales bacterium]